MTAATATAAGAGRQKIMYASLGIVALFGISRVGLPSLSGESASKTPIPAAERPITLPQVLTQPVAATAPFTAAARNPFVMGKAVAMPPDVSPQATFAVALAHEAVTAVQAVVKGQSTATISQAQLQKADAKVGWMAPAADGAKLGLTAATPTDVSWLATASAVEIAAKSASGSCYFVRIENTGDVSYGRSVTAPTCAAGAFAGEFNADPVAAGW
jgi:hypothetical protein